MRRYLAPLSIALFLVGCTGQKRENPTLDAHLKNPLFAEWYYEELVQRMVELEIKQDPLLQDASKKAIADSTRKDALQKAKEASKKQLQGMFGSFISVLEYVKGEALYLDDHVYFGPDFSSTAGISVHVFLTTTVDPRDVAFPDETAIDLGPLESPYQSGTYDVPPVEDPLLYRTMVLFDTSLGRIHGFAQLSPSF